MAYAFGSNVDKGARTLPRDQCKGPLYVCGICVYRGPVLVSPVPSSPAGAAPASWQEDTPTTDDPLPPGWEAAVDPESGATYYYDDAGTTSWTRPGGRPKTEVALSPVSMQTNPNGTYF